jgi:hypothetical protein
MINQQEIPHSAWAYHASGWPLDTAPRWYTNDDGDQLALRLPDGVIGLYIHDSPAFDLLAWAEEKYGVLPTTWTSKPQAIPSAGLTRLYRVPTDRIWREIMPHGPVVIHGNEIAVWPSYAPDLEAQFVWQYGTDRGSLTPPAFDALPALPELWIDHLAVERGTSPATIPRFGTTSSDMIRRFLNLTFVATGSQDDQIATEDIHNLYLRWAQIAPTFHAPPSRALIGRICAERFEPWSGRTEQGFRRGFVGLRFPEATRHD